MNKILFNLSVTENNLATAQWTGWISFFILCTLVVCISLWMKREMALFKKKLRQEVDQHSRNIASNLNVMDKAVKDMDAEVMRRKQSFAQIQSDGRAYLETLKQIVNSFKKKESQNGTSTGEGDSSSS